MTGVNDAQHPSDISPRAWLRGWLLVLVLTALVYRPVVTGDGTFEAWDQARVYVPLQISNAQQRSEGEIPLWYRHGFLGYPLQGENECSGVYPPAIIFHLVNSPGTAWSLFLLFHHLLAVAGTMLLVRELGGGVLGATLAAVVFVFGGTFVGVIPGATLLTTVAWTPLVLALWLKANRTHSLWPATWAGLALAAQASGAHPQILFYTILALVLGIVCEARRENRARKMGWAVLATTVTLVVGLGLAAPQLWYCLDTLLATERGTGLSYEQQMDGSLPPHFLLQLLLPGSTGGDHRLQVLFMDVRIYAGLLTLPLAVIGWCRAPDTARIFRWGLALSLVLAFGRHGGAFLLLGHLPGFDTIHVPARFLILTSLALAVLGGLGFDHLIKQPGTSTARSWRTTAVALAVTGIALLALGLVTRFAPESLGPDWLFGHGNSDAVFRREWSLVSPTSKMTGMEWAGFAGGITALVAAGICLTARRLEPRHVGSLCLLLVCCDLGLAATRLLELAPGDFYETPPVTLDLLPENPGRVAATVPGYNFNTAERTLALLPDNSAGLFGIDAFSINPGAKTELLRRTSAAVSPKLHAVLHVGTLISRRQLPTLDQHLRGHTSDSGGDYWIYDVPNVLPRVTICRDILLVTRPQAILDTIASRRFVPGETVILETAPQHVAGNPVGSSARESVTLVTDRAQTVEIDATLTSDGILVLADLFHDGWMATSNGRPLPILRTNGLCRGVALAAGQHRLRFEFQPASFHRGLWISATTLLGLLLGCGITIVRRRR